MKTKEHWSEEKQRYLASDEEYEFYKYSDHVSIVFVVVVLAIAVAGVGIGAFIFNSFLKSLL